MGLEDLIGAGKPEEYVAGVLLILEGRWIIRLKEKQVKVPRGLGRGALVGRTEKHVAQPRSFALPPFDLVLPGPVGARIIVIRTLEDLGQGVEVGEVEPVLVQAFRPLGDLGVIVHGFLDVEVELAPGATFGVLFCGRDELAVDRLHDEPERRFHLAPQVIGRVATQFGNQRIKKTEGVPQGLGCQAHRLFNVTHRQPVQAQTVNDTPGQLLVFPFGVACLYQLLEL